MSDGVRLWLLNKVLYTSNQCEETIWGYLLLVKMLEPSICKQRNFLPHWLSWFPWHWHWMKWF